MLFSAITLTRPHYKFTYISFNGSLRTSASGLQFLPLLFHTTSRFCLNRDTLINSYRWGALALQSIPSCTVSSFIFLSSIISRYCFVPLSCFFQRRSFNYIRRISGERNTHVLCPLRLDNPAAYSYMRCELSLLVWQCVSTRKHAWPVFWLL